MQETEANGDDDDQNQNNEHTQRKKGKYFLIFANYNRGIIELLYPIQLYS